MSADYFKNFFFFLKKTHILMKLTLCMLCNFSCVCLLLIFLKVTFVLKILRELFRRGVDASQCTIVGGWRPRATVHRVIYISVCYFPFV